MSLALLIQAWLLHHIRLWTYNLILWSKKYIHISQILEYLCVLSLHIFYSKAFLLGECFSLPQGWDKVT